MAYNFNSNQGNISQIPQMPNNSALINQNIQPIFPQPQGNVYNINSTLEVANVPVGAGISVALCLSEGVMYIKSMQNGNPLFWAYKVEPYDSTSNKNQNTQDNSQKQEDKNNINQLFEQYNNRFLKIENEINNIQSTLKKSNGGEFQL